MKLGEKILETFAPSFAAGRIRAKAELRIAKQGLTELDKYINYSQHGASTTKNVFRHLDDNLYSPDEDIGDNIDVLMARSRQLYMGSNVATGAIKKIRTNVVGRGIKLKSKINNKILNLKEDQLREYQSQIQTMWNLWANSPDECDITGQSNFYQLQSLAILTQLIDGECFVLMPYRKREKNLFNLKLQFIDSARCITPVANYADGKIKNGIEIDDDGRPVAYYFLKNYNSVDFVKVATYTKSGRKNVLSLLEKERIGQRRGVPLLAPVIEALHQIMKFTNAELTNAVVSSIFAAFIKKSDTNTNPIGKMMGVSKDPTNSGEKSEINLKMGTGTIMELNQGEDLIFADPKRPNANFDIFFTTVCKELGTALEIPLEVLLSHFNASYSASKAALEEVWKMYSMRREWLSTQFCQPVFEELIDECVERGYLNLPGYLDNPLKRRAYLSAEWYGETQSQLDPLKEIRAASERVALGVSTIATEARAINGSDWEDNFEQLSLEKNIKKELGLNVDESSD